MPPPCNPETHRVTCAHRAFCKFGRKVLFTILFHSKHSPSLRHASSRTSRFPHVLFFSSPLSLFVAIFHISLPLASFSFSFSFSHLTSFFVATDGCGMFSFLRFERRRTGAVSEGRRLVPPPCRGVWRPCPRPLHRRVSKDFAGNDEITKYKHPSVALFGARELLPRGKQSLLSSYSDYYVRGWGGIP